MKQPVPGTFSVRDGYYRGDHYHLTGVLAAPGVAPHAAEVKVGNMHDRWQHSATVDLPALVDATEPTNFRVLWDDVPQVTQQQLARRVAEQAAAAANGQAVPGGPTTGLTGPELMAFQRMSGPGSLAGNLFANGAGGIASQLAGLAGLGGSGGPAGPAVHLPPGSTTRVSTSVTVNGVPVDPGVAGQEVSAMLQSFGLGSMLSSAAGAAHDTGAAESEPTASPLPEAALRQGAGEPGTATVLSAHPVPEDRWPAGPRPPAGYLTYALDVTGADGTTWSATALLGFTTPERRDQTAAVGGALPVRYDPADRSRVAIDLTRLPPVA